MNGVIIAKCRSSDFLSGFIFHLFISCYTVLGSVTQSNNPLSEVFRHFVFSVISMVCWLELFLFLFYLCPFFVLFNLFLLSIDLCFMLYVASLFGLLAFIFLLIFQFSASIKTCNILLTYHILYLINITF